MLEWRTLQRVADAGDDRVSASVHKRAEWCCCCCDTSHFLFALRRVLSLLLLLVWCSLWC